MNKTIFFLVTCLLLISCKKTFEEPKIENYEITEIYNELKTDNLYTKFIGYHIVRRDGENQFYYYNLISPASILETPVLYDKEYSELRGQTKSFFARNPNAKYQFDTMKKLGIKAVLTDNYNLETKRLESNDNVIYDFKHYKLTFMLSDSIEISTINFSYDDYLQIKSQYYEVTEKLDSNWFVSKRK